MGGSTLGTCLSLLSLRLTALVHPQSPPKRKKETTAGPLLLWATGVIHAPPLPFWRPGSSSNIVRGPLCCPRLLPGSQLASVCGSRRAGPQTIGLAFGKRTTQDCPASQAGLCSPTPGLGRERGGRSLAWGGRGCRWGRVATGAVAFASREGPNLTAASTAPPGMGAPGKRAVRARRGGQPRPRPRPRTTPPPGKGHVARRRPGQAEGAGRQARSPHPRRAELRTGKLGGPGE